MFNKITKDYKHNSLNTFLNPYSYLCIRDESHLIDGIDAFLIDGQMLVSFYNFLFKNKVSRKSFDMTSLAPQIFQYSIESNKSIYFIGSKQEDIEEAVKAFEVKFPGINIAGYRNGYLKTKEEYLETIKHIVKLNPDIVIVGMGTPRQEQFLIDLKKSKWHGTGFTCGGFFHQTAKKIDYYPLIFDKLHLRWLYRIIDEPKLIRRYSIDYTKFIFVFLYDFIKKKKNS